MLKLKSDSQKVKQRYLEEMAVFHAEILANRKTILNFNFSIIGKYLVIFYTIILARKIDLLLWHFCHE